MNLKLLALFHLANGLQIQPKFNNNNKNTNTKKSKSKKSFRENFGNKLGDNLRDKIDFTNDLKVRYRKKRIRDIARKKNSIPPSEIDPDKVKKMETIGFFWNEYNKTWERKSISKENFQENFPGNKSKGVVEKKVEDIVENYEDYEDYNGYNSSQIEKLKRLGFRIENNKCFRVKPRQSEKTIDIIDYTNNNRLIVKAITETQIQACNRLQYIITKSQIQTPENFFNFIFQVVRIDYFLLFWISLQLKTYSAFSIFQDIQIQNINDYSQNDIILTSLIIPSIFGLQYLISSFWNILNGNLQTDSLEKALSDTIIGNKESAPYTVKWRKEIGGNLWKYTFTFLSIFSIINRILFIHSYTQTKISNFFIESSSLDAVLDSSHMNNAHMSTYVILGAISFIVEYFFYYWANKPKNEIDTFKEIQETLKEDALIKKYADKNPYTSKLTLQKISDYEKIANTWCQSFYSSIIFTNDELNRIYISFITSSQVLLYSIFYDHFSLYETFIVQFIINIIILFIPFQEKSSTQNFFQLNQWDSSSDTESNTGDKP
tara:strand:- start:15198 stop:16835 length:1638 start_codon:yes stop_codon:yes gene_type:complete